MGDIFSVIFGIAILAVILEQMSGLDYISDFIFNFIANLTPLLVVLIIFSSFAPMLKRFFK